MSATLLLCDWGTTRLRAWTVDALGEIVKSATLELGVSTLAPGEAGNVFANTIRSALDAEDLPALLCGMVGSNLGWTTVPYLSCPAGPAQMAAALTKVADSPVAQIAPGLRCVGLTGAADVMRGEECQVFGWLEADPARRVGRRLICHPGTHAKWILVQDGIVIRFITVMTGELFATLRKHGVLANAAAPQLDAAFEAGVAAAGDGGLLTARLFAGRGRVVGDGEHATSTPSYLSGLLIGAEVAAAPALLGAADLTIDLLGDLELCSWYECALTLRGVTSTTHNGEAAVLAGLLAIHRQGV